MNTEREDQPKHLDAKEARQGNPGRPVLYVLLGSIAVSVFYWGATLIYGAMIAEDTGATAPAQPAAGAPATPPNTQSQ